MFNEGVHEGSEEPVMSSTPSGDVEVVPETQAEGGSDMETDVEEVHFQNKVYFCRRRQSMVNAQLSDVSLG